MNKRIIALAALLTILALLLAPLGVSPRAVAQTTPPGSNLPPTLPPEILERQGQSFSIDELLAASGGPISPALWAYTDRPVTVIVEMDTPSVVSRLAPEELAPDAWSRGNMQRERAAAVQQIERGQQPLVTAVNRAGGSVISQYKYAYNGVMVSVPANQIEALRETEGVKSVHLAPEYTLSLSASVPAIDAPEVWAATPEGFDGAGVTIAVIDSGIDYTHAALGGSGVSQDYTNNDPDVIEPGTFPNAKVIDGHDFAGTAYNPRTNPTPVEDDDPLDEYGHGTHVASIAAGLAAGPVSAGVAPGADLIALKIFGASDGTNLVMAALDWVVARNTDDDPATPSVDVVNFSLGSYWGIADQPVQDAIQALTNLGIVVVAAAGNEGNSSYIVAEPSVADTAISVAAVYTSAPQSPAPFTSRGPRGYDSVLKPEIAAPGVNIYAAAMGGGTQGVSYSGTSMAAPHVAGVAALVRQAHPLWTQQTVKAAMMSNASDPASVVIRDVPRIGAGVVNANSAVFAESIVYSDPDLVSLNWGVVEVGSATVTLPSQDLTIENLSASNKTYNASVTFSDNQFGGAPVTDVFTITVNNGQPISVGAGSTGQVPVTLAINAGPFATFNDIPDIDEVYGYITFSESPSSATPSLRVPFYFIPRPYDVLTERADQDKTLSRVTTATVFFDRSGPSYSSAADSAWPLLVIDENEPAVLDAADVRAVGMDTVGIDPDYGSIIGIATAYWGPIYMPQFPALDTNLFVDTNNDGPYEWRYIVYNVGGAYSAHENNEWILLKCTTNLSACYLGSPYYVRADFNSGVQAWYIPAGWMFGNDTDSRLSFQIGTFDLEGHNDQTTRAYFDYKNPPLDTSVLIGSDSIGVEARIRSQSGYQFADPKGLLLFYWNGQPGAGQSHLIEGLVVVQDEVIYLPFVVK